MLHVDPFLDNATSKRSLTRLSVNCIFLHRHLLISISSYIYICVCREVSSNKGYLQIIKKTLGNHHIYIYPDESTRRTGNRILCMSTFDFRWVPRKFGDDLAKLLAWLYHFVVGHPLCAQDTVNNGTHGQEPRPMHCAVVFFFGKHKSFLTNLMLETVEEVMTIVIDNNL